MIRRIELREYVKGRQQNYAAARALLPQAMEKLNFERAKVAENIEAVLSSLVPFLPSEVSYEVCLVDDCDVAETISVDDGAQLIVVNRHFIAFLRNFIELIARGIRLDDGGRGVVNYEIPEDERRIFGVGIGEYLNFGSPLISPSRQSGDLGPDIFIAAIEFILSHEIVHRIEGDDEGFDLELDGFQDFCRIRGREYRCDRRAVALVLERRKGLDMPETAFLGAVGALMAVSWIQQFTPGYIPESWHHPGSDSRVLRVHLEEPLLWKAAGLDGQPNGITGAAIRRAFRFMAALEAEPKLIASPLNHLISSCIATGSPDHDTFEARIGEIFARGRAKHVAQSLGAMWGSSERMEEEERIGNFEFPQGQLSCALFSRMYKRLLAAGPAAGELAAEIYRAKERRLNSQEP
ncbi:hypothetical protein [Asticcacaulis benevestitus]|uniref:Uncharacterized protein n=1 Tax=Asticcacaulis benevestitus DSM 16100 = ATCC BAA-896 TaxID=1121022 RepID=V4P4G4_9CAUL|nr:hypothetical protein [Asticcacaulis benevestitus]ESQ82986.1 hypothetical protein ABENE_20470 [Asticcacaulis benevestitus DSM 16100 = ATCC BAA-896]